MGCVGTGESHLRARQGMFKRHVPDQSHAAPNRCDHEEQQRLSGAGWVSTLLLKWLRKRCNHPAQGLTMIDQPEV